MSKQERTMWRDEGLSQRHRAWGDNCPAVDIDFLLLEYDKGAPIAVIDYKHENSKDIDYQNRPSYRAIISMADTSKLPFFIVKYSSDFSRWVVIPLNSYASKWINGVTELNEVEFVSLLYAMRNKPLPDGVFPVNESIQSSQFSRTHTHLNVIIRITRNANDNQQRLNKALELLESYQGDDNYRIVFLDERGNFMNYGDKGNTHVVPQLITELSTLLGDNNINAWQKIALS